MRGKIHWLIILLALLKFLLPYILPHPIWELHRDEYLYYEQGKHLGLGYLENTPLIGVLAFISSLFGGGEFWIKFWPAAIGALTLLLTARFAKELGGGLFAQVLAAIGVIFSAYLRIHYLFQPNMLDILFWTLAAYFLVRYVNAKEDKYLYLLAIALALGFWSKYSILFIIVALILSLAISQYRYLFGRKAFWYSVLFFLVLILPNLAWQYMHKFPLVHHMKELRETQLQHLDKTDFLKEQLLLLFPVTIVWIGGLVWLLRNPKYRLIAFIYILIILLLTFGNAKGYYSLGAYPMLLAAGGTWFEKITTRVVWVRYAITALIIVLSFPSLFLLLPIQSPPGMQAFNKKYSIDKIGLLRWEDMEDHALQQDFADMLGWKELSAKSEKFYETLPATEKNLTAVYCRNYGLAGGIRYYSKDKQFSNKVFSDNGSFLLWIPEQLRFKNLLFVGWEMPNKDDEVFQHFGKVRLIDSCANPLSRQYRYKIIYFENGTDSAWHLAQAGLSKMKDEFRRR
jgi:4-amino-4-deoxy-L-arabinose transferase-like glycosyltransferase